MNKVVYKNLSYNLAKEIYTKARKRLGFVLLCGNTHIKMNNDLVEVYWHKKHVANIRPENTVELIEPPNTWSNRAKWFFNIYSTGYDCNNQRSFCVGWTRYQSKYSAGMSDKFVFHKGTIIDPVDFKLIRAQKTATEVYDKHQASVWRKQIMKFLKTCRSYCKLGALQQYVDKRTKLSYTSAEKLDYVMVHGMHHDIINENYIEFAQRVVDVTHHWNIKHIETEKLMSKGYNRAANRIKRLAGVYVSTPGEYVGEPFVSEDHVTDRVCETTEGHAAASPDQVAENVGERDTRVGA